MGYFRNIGRGIKTSFKGMSLTMKHLWAARKNRRANDIQNAGYFDRTSGRVTVQFPHESLLIPDNGRYQLDCEIDDCIVCDKCAKVCPVDCIEIDAIKSSEIINYASDGSPIRLYAAKFDIDMAKCCFCGLCTTVCPTECLTMSSEYDFSVRDVHALNFAFAKLTPEQAEEKRNLYEQFVAEKNAAKTTKPAEAIAEPSSEPKKPAFRPSFKPASTATSEPKPEIKPIEEAETKPKPSFRPKFKANGTENGESSEKTPESKPIEAKEDTPKPSFRPKFKVNSAAANDTPKVENIVEVAPAEEEVKPKPNPSFKPKFKINKPEDKPAEEKIVEEIKEEVVEEKPKPNPSFRPKFKLKTETPQAAETPIVAEETKPDTEPNEEEKPKTVSFRPKFKLPNKD